MPFKLKKMVTNSPDITNLLVDVIWDISGNTPAVELVNNSTGPNLGNMTYAFKIKSPSGTWIYDGDIDTPDITGVWSGFTFYSANPGNVSPDPTQFIVAPWPLPFRQIEWSGANYSLTVFAKDSHGNIFELDFSQQICHPAGNKSNSKNTYGLGIVALKMDCGTASSFFEDITNTSYLGNAGTRESSQLKVLYPDDETDTAPAPFIIQNFSNAIVPISYDSSNYELVYNSVFLYDFGNGSFVRIKYYIKKQFSVVCNIDLCPLVCAYDKMLDKLASGDCTNATELTQKSIIINGKLNLAMIAKSQPLCGIDLFALIEEIKLIGGFDCDCCAPNGIQPFNGATIGDYNFQIIPGGGDIGGSVSVTGNNIQFTLYDKSYIFKMCDDVPTAAFTVTPSINGSQKTYCLNVNLSTLAGDILTATKNDAGLVALFNSIVEVATSNLSLIVDGGCIFNSTASCDYTFDLATIPASSTYAILTSIKVGILSKSLNFPFNLTNLAALQTYLNTLNIGVFTVANAGGGNVTISSSDNTYGIIALTYKVAPTNFIANQTTNCTGYAPLSANEVVQKIIYYLCGITDNEVTTSMDYTISYIDPTDNTLKTVTVNGGAQLNAFITTLLDRGADTANYVISLKPITCDNILNVFPQNTIATLQPNDFLLGTKNGECAQVGPMEAFLSMLTNAAFSQEILDAFCVLNKLCNAGQVCTPFSILSTYNIFDSPADNMMQIVVDTAHPLATTAGIAGYRIDINSSIMGRSPDFYGQIPISNNPAAPTVFTSAPVSEGQYLIVLTPTYSGSVNCPAINIQTQPCGQITSFGLSISADNKTIYINYTASCLFIYYNIRFPNGSFYTGIVPNTGAQIAILLSTITSFQSGTYTVYLKPACNVTTGWFGASTNTATIFLPITQLLARLGNNTDSICNLAQIPVYSPTPFGAGAKLYYDAAATNPVTGFYYIEVTGGEIWFLNQTNTVQYDTGLNCNTGIAGVYRINSDSGTICSAGTTVLYTKVPFAIGVTMYLDPACIDIVTSATFIVLAAGGNVYNLSDLGVVGSSVGSC